MCIVGFVRLVSWFNTLMPGSVYNNSLAPGRCGNNFKRMIFKRIIQNSNIGTRWEIGLMRMPQNLTNEKSIFFSNGLVPLMKQAITWASVDPGETIDHSIPVMSVGLLETELKVLMNMQKRSFSEINFKMSSAAWLLFRPGLILLNQASKQLWTLVVEVIIWVLCYQFRSLFPS